ncbi:MAG: hypothetical protein HFG37_11100 [Eubacterium sp.]|nr:hypothetical protein [Eubacterium sp.]
MKYKDPSGMFSLPECNLASAIGVELYQNQNVILGMPATQVNLYGIPQGFYLKGHSESVG